MIIWWHSSIEELIVADPPMQSSTIASLSCGLMGDALQTATQVREDRTVHRRILEAAKIGMGVSVLAQAMFDALSMYSFLCLSIKC